MVDDGWIWMVASSEWQWLIMINWHTDLCMPCSHWHSQAAWQRWLGVPKTDQRMTCLTIISRQPWGITSSSYLNLCTSPPWLTTVDVVCDRVNSAALREIQWLCQPWQGPPKVQQQQQRQQWQQQQPMGFSGSWVDSVLRCTIAAANCQLPWVVDKTYGSTIVNLQTYW